MCMVLWMERLSVGLRGALSGSGGQVLINGEMKGVPFDAGKKASAAGSRHAAMLAPRLWSVGWFATLLMVLFCQFHSAPARAEHNCANVALVFSIDASTSISEEEYLLQILGIASALRSAEVLDILDQAGKVAMAAVVWSSTGLPRTETPWVLITSAEEADLFASNLQRLPRPMRGDTGLASGLLAALQKFESLAVCSVRRIINVSGDGEETVAIRRPRESPMPHQVRDLAETQGVEINALAIGDDEELARYYEENIITGPDAFVKKVNSFKEISAAFQRKIIREVGLRYVSAR